ncbi:TVP38/TMEM64 family protein [Terrilactibacillus laevilacticus]|uniref:TVP38/TMEM64 family protein n=1 Tax=Terrilactibacillus laevilacticus TaxID=1380157 RepID=UPI001FED23BF|nr:TVP38/TMEM64 family protein [Terrilactibacillus laevilacticus]
MNEKWKKRRLLIGMIVLVCLGMIGVYYGHGINQDTLNRLSKLVQNLRLWGELGYVLVYTIRPFILFPATPLTLFGGYTFGAVHGTILDIIGAGTGACLAFLVSRYLGRDTVASWLQNKKISKLDHVLNRNGFLAVLYLRLIPILPFDSVNYGMGLTSIRTRDYVLATYLGIIPGAFTLNFLGSSLHGVNSRLWMAIGLYAFMAVIPVIIKKMNGRNKTKNSPKESR